MTSNRKSIKVKVIPGFSKSTILDLTNRSAHRCSNPSCYKITTGPKLGPEGHHNIGEAAHIYGKQPGSSRHRPNIPISEVNKITNGIWLCRNCHNTVDSDEKMYTPELLFSWKSSHEHKCASQLGIEDSWELPYFFVEFKNYINPYAKQIIRSEVDNYISIATIEIIDFILESYMLKIQKCEIQSMLNGHNYINYNILDNIRNVNHTLSLITSDTMSIINNDIANALKTTNYNKNTDIPKLITNIIKICEKVQNTEMYLKNSKFDGVFETVTVVYSNQPIRHLIFLKKVFDSIRSVFMKNTSIIFEEEYIYENPPGWESLLESELAKWIRALSV